MSTTDLGPLLGAVGADWEISKTICERAGIDSRTGGQRLGRLERDGLVESKSTRLDSSYRGRRLYRRTAAAAPLPTDLRSVENVRATWEIRVRVRDGVVGMSAGTWNAHGAEGSSHGLLVNVPDAPSLRSLIGNLNRALDQIEGRA
jgi:hypothetical protein